MVTKKTTTTTVKPITVTAPVAPVVATTTVSGDVKVLDYARSCASCGALTTISIAGKAKCLRCIEYEIKNGILKLKVL